MKLIIKVQSKYNFTPLIYSFQLFLILERISWNFCLENLTMFNSNQFNPKNPNLDSLIEKVDKLILAQSQASSSSASNIASRAAKQRLAEISSHWSKVAQNLVYWKSNEVIELTKKAQDAQIVSLKFSSIANRLKGAVMSADEVFKSAFER